MEAPEVLALAARENRVLVSHDVGTMPSHFRALGKLRKHSAGVLLIPQTLDVATAIEELLLIRLATEASERVNRLEWLPL
jgi:hypothetical protein